MEEGKRCALQGTLPQAILSLRGNGGLRWSRPDAGFRFDYNPPFTYPASYGSYMPLFRMPLCLLLVNLAVAGSLTACGQKGRLYLEGQEPPSQRAVIKKKRAAQAKQAEAQMRNAQGHDDDADDNGKDNAPELAPSAPN